MKWTVSMALGAAFGTAWTNFGAFLIVALVLSLPSVIVDSLAASSVVSTIVSSLVIAAMTACGTYGAIRMMAGEKTSAGAMLLRIAQPSFWPLVVLSMIQSVAIACGLVLLVVPGVILLGMWMIAAPVMVVERLGIVDSLQRSAELTKGSRFTGISTFVAAILLSLVVLVAGLAVIYVGLELDKPLLLVAMVEWLLGAVYMALLAPLQATIYVLQRQEKEAITVADMARQL
ncbi:MAG: hypothetical protein EBY18_19170 [Alphaproteobacteria bacterium]|nr:hypothetical protein [Alphaproteobacteria bacterium]